jgi:hypothetical protein
MNLKTETSVPKMVWAAVWICVLSIGVANSEDISDVELEKIMASAYDAGFIAGRDKAMKLSEACQQELAATRAPIDDDSNNPRSGTAR